MLAAAIALLFILSGLLAVLAIADAALKARRAYGVLMAEAAVMRTGYAVQALRQDMPVRRAAVRKAPGAVRLDRRSSALGLALAPQRRLPAVPAFAAA
jgi:uncharacterized protein GlcG (DUF336 family)